MTATVLIVDDNEGIRETLNEIMLEMGYLTVTAVDGADALNKLSQVKVDIVLTDVKMPVMDGIDMLRQIRENHDQKGLPVIVMSGFNDYTEQEILALGANCFYNKPVNLESILEDMDKFLQ